MRRGRVTALGAVAISIPLIAASAVLPASAEPAQPPPIAVDLLTSRGVFTDQVSLKVKNKVEGRGTEVAQLRDASRIVVAEITVQPGARFPLHTHAGPVFVNVIEGELTYVDPHRCQERVYEEGTAFVDMGADVHSAYGSSSEQTVLIATFFGASEDGPLTIPEGVQTPTSCPS